MDGIMAVIIGIALGLWFGLIIFSPERRLSDGSDRMERDGIVYTIEIDTAATDSLNNWRNK